MNLGRNKTFEERVRYVIVLLDGTWNDSGTSAQDTNVVRIRDLIARCLGEYFPVQTLEEVVEIDNPLADLGIRSQGDVDYCFFYQRGVGTGPGHDRVTGGAFGWGLGRNIRRAYRFVSRYYRPGDKLFIIGFSRGSFTARSLVGYLGAAGLLRPEYCDADREHAAWSYYRTRPNDRLPATRITLAPFMFPSADLRVSCLAVFDTVGALGIPSTIMQKLNRVVNEYHDVELSPIVRVNLHALAIDEQRKPFEASVWRRSRFRAQNSIVEQTWFPGVHADVGGGYFTEKEQTDERRLEEVSLDWMLKRIRRHYPDFLPYLNSVHVELGRNTELPVQHDSRKRIYLLYPPGIRSIGNRKPRLKGRQKHVSFDRSEASLCESIHISAIQRLGKHVRVNRNSRERLYAPPNLLAALPDLFERYCKPSVAFPRAWGSEALSVTDWSGDVIQDGWSTEAGMEVSELIREAISLLRDAGIDPEINEDAPVMQPAAPL